MSGLSWPTVSRRRRPVVELALKTLDVGQRQGRQRACGRNGRDVA
jgi:hypothetical protein